MISYKKLARYPIRPITQAARTSRINCSEGCPAPPHATHKAASKIGLPRVGLKTGNPSTRPNRTWTPPLASVASRRPPKRSRGSFCGSFVNPRTNREVVFESTLERDLAYILLTTASVRDLRDQVGPIEYLDDNGLRRSHTLDFVAELKSGNRAAIAVKPARRVEASGIRRTLDQIRSQNNSVAEYFEACTGNHITTDRSSNARLMHRALRAKSNSDASMIMTFAATLRGAVTIRALLSSTRDDGDGFMAVAFLIAEGALEHLGLGRISRDSFVRLRRTNADGENPHEKRPQIDSR